METLPDRPAASAPGDADRLAPRPEGGPVARLAAHTQGLVDDLKTWVDLRLDMVVLEVEEKVDDLQNKIALGILLAGLGLFAAFFGLAALALGLTWASQALFGGPLAPHLFVGFALVTLVLAVAAAILAKAKPALAPPTDLFRKVRRAEQDADDADAEPKRGIRDAQATITDD